MLRHYTSTESYWESYVLTADNASYVWQAPNDPDSLGFSPQDGEFSAEVVNEHDQSGGDTSLPMYLDAAYWWDSSYNVRSTNWQGAERFCQLCDASGPYNVTYVDGDTLKVWTDGF